MRPLNLVRSGTYTVELRGNILENGTLKFVQFTMGSISLAVQQGRSRIGASTSHRIYRQEEGRRNAAWARESSGRSHGSAYRSFPRQASHFTRLDAVSASRRVVQHALPELNVPAGIWNI
jgi:hypothetical protein